MIENSKNEEETIKIAFKIGASLRGGDILSLVGNLGAGKTVFTKGLSKCLGVKSGVKSPTFTLMNVYRAKNDQGIKTICHIDAYRLNSASDLLNIGAQDFFDDQETLTVIEWGDKVRDILPRRSKIVVIEALSENNRKICFKK